MKKTCSVCKIEKEENDFYKDIRGKFGLFSKCKACLQKYYEEKYKNDPEKYLKRVKKYVDENKEKHIKCCNNWQENHSIDFFYNSYRRNAKKDSRDFTITKNEFKNIVLDKCYYCGVESRDSVKISSRHKINGIDRIDNEKGYTLDNCRTCCWTCNRCKASMTLEEFSTWIFKVYANLSKEH